MSILVTLWIIYSVNYVSMNQSLIDKFKKGRCTADEVKAILDWYGSEGCDKHYSKEIEKAIKKYDESIVVQHADKEDIYKKIKAAIAHDSTGDRKRRFLHQRIASIAAALLILAVVFAVVFEYTQRKNGEGNELIVEKDAKSTTIGQKSTIFLNDGSIITLNSASSIVYPATFGDESREVELTGEAFFQIAPDPKKPFIVHTNGLSVTALGTSFNIRSYSHENDIQVALNSGKIKVADNRQSAIIDTPNKGVLYNNPNKKMETFQFDYKEAFAWKDGILYFKNAHFEEMIDRFEHWYGVRFHIANVEKSDDKPFTGEFENETLANVLKGLSFSKNFAFDIQDNDVYIEFK